MNTLEVCRWVRRFDVGKGIRALQVKGEAPFARGRKWLRIFILSLFIRKSSESFYSEAFLRSASNPFKISFGEGGFPGILMSTGRILSTPPSTA